MQMTYALSLSNKDINYITNRTYSGNYSKQYVYYYILKKYDSISAEKFDIAYSEKMLSKEAG